LKHTKEYSTLKKIKNKKFASKNKNKKFNKKIDFSKEER
jgi:hypothetical protein